MLETKETVAKIIQSKGILKDNTNIIIGSDNDLSLIHIFYAQIKLLIKRS